MRNKNKNNFKIKKFRKKKLKNRLKTNKGETTEIYLNTQKIIIIISIIIEGKILKKQTN